MKKNLKDISLTELREFIKNAELFCNIKLSGLSLISLKLRLQFLILQNQFLDFNSFYKHYLENEEYRNTINANILTQGNELFRDAENWDLFIAEIKQNDQQISICLFDSGNFYDAITFLICLERFDLLSKIDLTIVSTTTINPFRFTHHFTEKDIEMAIINYSSLKSNKTLSEFIKLISPYKYQYTVSDQIPIKIISFNEHLSNNIRYDAVIARNITLNYNFTFHEILFNNYLEILKSKGILFTGNKEGFKWCSQFKSITYATKSIPIYRKL